MSNLSQFFGGKRKVTLADLVAVSSLADADLLLTRQGTTDKSVTAAILAQYILAELAPDFVNVSGDTMTGALALFGGDTGVTPPQFDNDTSLATTAFVQRALGNMQGLRAISTNTTLTAADAGKLITSNVGTGAVTCQLPLSSAVPDGATFVISHSSSAMTSFGVAVSGADLLVFDGLSVNASPYAMSYGETIVVVSAGSIWKVVAGNGAKMLNLGGAFGSSLAANGYQRLPSGLIIQWGNFAASATIGQPVTVTYPVAFPNASLSNAVIRTATGVSADANTFTVDPSSNASFVVRCQQASATFRWIAIGY